MKLSPTIFAIVLPLLVGSCRKEHIEVDNLNGGKVIALGHGGMGIHDLLPMNSAASLLSALHTGADGTEMDVRLTLDGKLVAFHDLDLSVSTTGTGAIADLTWAQVAQARYLQPLYGDHGIVDIDHFLSHADVPSGAILYFDVKPDPGAQDPALYRERMADAMAALFTRHDLLARSFVECRDIGIAVAVQARLPSARLLSYSPSFDEALGLAVQHDLFGVSHFGDQVSADQVRTAHEQGKWVALVAEHRNEQRSTGEKGPEIIISDELKHLADLLE